MLLLACIESQFLVAESHFCVIKQGKKTTKYWHSCSKKLLQNHLSFAFLHKQNFSRWSWPVSGQSFITNIFPYFVAQGFPNSGGLWAINFCPAQISGFKLLPTNFNIQRQKLHARIPREKTVCGPWIWLDPIDWSFFLLTIWTRPTKYCEHLMLTHKIVPQMCARKTGWQIQALHNLESTQKVVAIVSYWQMKFSSLFRWPIFVPKSFSNTVGLWANTFFINTNLWLNSPTQILWENFNGQHKNCLPTCLVKKWFVGHEFG